MKLSIFTLAFLVASPVAVHAQDPVEKGPSEERIREVVERVETTLDGDERQPKVAALQEASEVPAPEVVAAITRGFKDKEKEVRNAAIQALRWMKHPEALETLHRTFKNDRSMRKDEELSAALLKAIGQHGSASSIKLLSHDPYETNTYPAVRARVLGLGMIRHVDSVEALLKLMKLTDQKRIDRYMDDFRLSLMMLTGTDQGPSSAAWQRWWNDHAKTLEVKAEPPELPRPFAMTWAQYWGLGEDYGRTKRREDRGDDPDRRKRRQ